jgi:hypothetical protein
MKKALIGYGGHAREVMCQMNQKHINVNYLIYKKVFVDY